MAEPVDTIARLLAGASLVLWGVTVLIAVLTFRRSGGRLRVRARLHKHHNDPLKNRVRIHVVNVGLLPLTVEAVGLEWDPSREGKVRLSVEASPTDETLPKELVHRDELVADVSVAEIARRWSWGTRFQLTAWASARGGQKATQWWSIFVTTPPAPLD